ncbi:MAG: hypothetical protein FWD61_18835 [Phycisphaerales bacterium]|nr:hypothetical protein [Phycisphaerales bacterium]
MPDWCASTERQEKIGESLRTQHAEIERAARELGGEVVKWYEGQEHGTPGWEKKMVDELLTEARKDKPLFDAVMVTGKCEDTSGEL